MSNLSIQGGAGGSGASGASQLQHDESRLLKDFSKLFNDMSTQGQQQSQGAQGSGDGGGQGAGGSSGAGGSQEIMQLLLQLLQQMLASQGGQNQGGGDPLQMMGQGSTPA